MPKSSTKRPRRKPTGKVNKARETKGYAGKGRKSPFPLVSRRGKQIIDPNRLVRTPTAVAWQDPVTLAELSTTRNSGLSKLVRSLMRQADQVDFHTPLWIHREACDSVAHAEVDGIECTCIPLIMHLGARA